MFLVILCLPSPDLSYLRPSNVCVCVCEGVSTWASSENFHRSLVPLKSCIKSTGVACEETTSPALLVV